MSHWNEICDNEKKLNIHVAWITQREGESLCWYKQKKLVLKEKKDIFIKNDDRFLTGPI